MRSKLVPHVLAHAAREGADASALADRFEVPELLRDPERWSMDAPAFSISASSESSAEAV